MTPGEQLLLVLAGLYVLESTVRVRRGAVLLVCGLGGAARVFGTHALPGPRRHGLRSLPLFPPAGRVFLSAPWTVSLSPDGALAYTAFSPNPGPRLEQERTLAAFGSFRHVAADGAAVRVDGRPLVATASRGEARHWAAVLESLAALPREQRGDAIRREVARSLDAAAAAQKVDAFRRGTRGLRALEAALLAHLFLAAPAAAVAWGLASTWIPLAAALAALQVVHGAVFTRASRGLPGRGERLAAVLLSPVAAARGSDLLALELLAGVHPVAAARALGSPDAGRLAGAVLRDARHPIEPACDDPRPEAAAVEAWFRRVVIEELERCGCAASAAGAPSAPCCPRCLTPYVAGAAARCADCNVALTEAPA